MSESSNTPIAADADNVVLVSGEAYIAPAGTTAPTNATTAMSTMTAFDNVGYIQKDSVSVKPTYNVKKIDTWKKDDVGAKGRPPKVDVSFVLMEYMNIAAQKLVNGNSAVSLSTGGALSKVAMFKGLPEERVLVLDCVLDDGSAIRYVIERFQVTEVGEIKLTPEDFAIMSVTGAALEPSDGEKVKTYFG